MTINRDVTDHSRTDGFAEFVERIAAEVWPGENMRCVRFVVQPTEDDDDLEPFVRYETRRTKTGRVLWFDADGLDLDEATDELVWMELEAMR